MFVIYKLSFPSDKSYIGKTKKGINHRVNQHINSAENNRNKCPYLENAIRKYGALNMKSEVVMICDEEFELSAWEIAFISEFNTLYPNGYNLTQGGDGNSSKHTHEFKLEKSKQMRKNHADKHLEMYVKYTTTIKGTEGYKVLNPNYKSAQFCSPELSMEEKLNLANEHARALERGEIIDVNRYIHIDIGYNDRPPGISYLSNFDGFRVKPPGKTTRYFKSKKLTRDQKYQLALEYYYE